MTRNNVLRWVGTVSYIIGIALSSFNVYPLYLLFQTNGAVFWVAAATGARDTPLMLLEGYALITYGSGIGLVAWRWWA